MSHEEQLPQDVLAKLQAVTNKRARIVIDHILEHGHITTEELEKTYGYSHAPRAARDVRELGIPLITFRVKSSDGRSIAAYKFGNLDDIQEGRLDGRQVYAKELKSALYLEQQEKCAICATMFAKRYLQVDHKIPYEIVGDVNHLLRDSQDYMLLCSACNRAKSWSCEHCPNWQTKSATICSQCYWASPQAYTHIGLREIRRIHIVWESDEVIIYEQLKEAADQIPLTVPDYVKKIVQKHLSSDQSANIQ